jgi:hypothetical protein
MKTKLLFSLMAILIVIAVMQSSGVNAASELPEREAADELSAGEEQRNNEMTDDGLRILPDVMQDRSGEGGNYLDGLEPDVWGKKGTEVSERIKQYGERQDQALWDSLYGEDYRGPAAVSYGEVMSEKDVSYVFQNPQLHLKSYEDTGGDILSLVFIGLLFVVLSIVICYLTMTLRKLKREKSV